MSLLDLGRKRLMSERAPGCDGMGCREQKRRKSTTGCEDEHGWLNFEANANLLDQSKAK